MKTWKKWVIASLVMAMLVACAVGILMGMANVQVLRIDYGDEVREYSIKRSIWSHMMANIRYDGSLQREYASRVASGDNPNDALMDISGDFASVISDLSAHEKPMVESKISFSKYQKVKLGNDENGANSPFEYTLGEDGLSLNSGAYERVLSGIDKNIVVDNLYDVIYPMSMETMQNRTKLLRTFATSYETSGDARRKNIHIATSYLDGTIVEPGNRLSFNDIVGERTPERGFEEAKVIINGEYVNGYGGGVCQVSTTLYNAWVLSGGGVIYATPHSLPPHYIDLSRDAMVSSYNDMILINNGKTPLYVRGYCGVNDVTFEIYGEDNGVRYEMESRTTGTTPITESIVGDESEDGDYEREILSEGVPGYTSEAYLVTYDANGIEIGRRFLREDTYKCQPRIVKIVKK